MCGHGREFAKVPGNRYNRSVIETTKPRRLTRVPLDFLLAVGEAALRRSPSPTLVAAPNGG